MKGSRAGGVPCWLITKAVEAELSTFLEQYADKILVDGRRAIVRNGYLPERTEQTGIGDVEVPRLATQHAKQTPSPVIPSAKWLIAVSSTCSPYLSKVRHNRRAWAARRSRFGQGHPH